MKGDRDELFSYKSNSEAQGEKARETIDNDSIVAHEVEAEAISIEPESINKAAGEFVAGSILHREIEKSENAIVGGDDYLYIRLQEAFSKAVRVDIIVSFIMESGVRLLEKDLNRLVEKGVPVRILTGNYLNITQPSALYLLKDIFGKKVDLKFYKDRGRSFHPKAYIFHYKYGGEIFIGSSNISKSALTRGIEWNFRIDKDKNDKDFNSFLYTFEELFYNESIVVDDEELSKYSEEWVRNKTVHDVVAVEEKSQDYQIKEPIIVSEYRRVKEKLGHVPSRVEMFKNINQGIYKNMKKSTKTNIFRNYLGFRQRVGDLTVEEYKLLGTVAERFLNMIEKTAMSKSYKMPILLAFYNEGAMKLRINGDDIYRSMKKFYEKDSYGVDMLNAKSTKDYKSWGKREYVSLAKRNPIKYLAQSEDEFFWIEGEEFCLVEELGEFVGDEVFIREFIDCVGVRCGEYYGGRFLGRE